jgi:hypothetical protein
MLLAARGAPNTVNAFLRNGVLTWINYAKDRLELYVDHRTLSVPVLPRRSATCRI